MLFVMNKYMKKFLYLCLTILACTMIASEIYVCTFIHDQYVSNENTNINSNIKHTSINIKLQFNNIISRIQYTLLRTTSLFRIKYMNEIYVTPSEYIDNVYLNNDPLKAISGTIAWMPQLRYDQLENYTLFCKEHITPNCSIYQINNITGEQENVTYRDYYYPIMLYTPSFSLPSAIIGRDMNYGITQTIINDAFMSKSITGSSRILFNNEYSIPLNQLVFKNTSNTDNNSIINKSLVSGVIIMALNISYIFDTIIRINGNIDRNNIDIFVFDSTNTTTLLFKEHYSQYDFITDIDNMSSIISQYTITDKYNIGTRNWTVFLKYNNDFVQKYIDNNKNIILFIVVGMFIICDIMIIVSFQLYYKIKENSVLIQEKNATSRKILNYVNHEMRNPIHIIDGMIDHIIYILQNKIKTYIPNISIYSPQVSAPRSLHKNIEPINILSIYDSPDSETKRLLDIRQPSVKITFEYEEIKTVLSDLQTVYGSCGMMKHIVNDILDIGKIEEGKMNVCNIEFELHEMLNYIKRSVTPKVNEKFSITFNIDCSKETKRLIIYSDKNRLMQVLLNLIFNAIKFTCEGSVTLKVIELDTILRFEIIDTGRGIPEDKRSYIFQPFHQVNVDDATRYNGTGLGLYLCNMLIKLLNGTIGFSSIYEVGSTFWIEIPIRYPIKKNVVVIHK